MVPFASTSVLEMFAGALAGPPNGNWARQGGASSDLQRDGNGFCTAAGTFAGAYWLPSFFGPDSEAFVTVSALPTGAGGNVRLHVRNVNPDVSATRTGYLLLWSWVTGAGNDTWQLFRRDAGVSTQIGSTLTGSDMAAGDKIGLDIVGSTVTGYHWTAAGGWVSVLTAADATYTTTGYIALGADQSPSALTMDDFGGGTIRGSWPSRALPMLSGP